jgi:hypothetical protein
MSFQIIYSQKIQKNKLRPLSEILLALVSRFRYKGKVFFKNSNWIVSVCQIIQILYTKNKDQIFFFIKNWETITKPTL